MQVWCSWNGSKRGQKSRILYQPAATVMITDQSCDNDDGDVGVGVGDVDGGGDDRDNDGDDDNDNDDDDGNGEPGRGSLGGARTQSDR